MPAVLESTAAVPRWEVPARGQVSNPQHGWAAFLDFFADRTLDVGACNYAASFDGPTDQSLLMAILDRAAGADVLIARYFRGSGIRGEVAWLSLHGQRPDARAR